MPRAPDDLAVFCEQQHPRLVGALSLYCGDALLAEEIAQEALRRACRDWPKVRQMSSPGAWVHRVGMNVAHSWFRRRAAERRALARSHEDRAVHPPETVEQLTVRDAVAALSERYRRVVVLRYFLGYSVAEVAEVTGLTASAVTSTTHRAMQVLRSRLDASDEENCDVRA